MYDIYLPHLHMEASTAMIATTASNVMGQYNKIEGIIFGVALIYTSLYYSVAGTDDEWKRMQLK